jgi:hypothetical protein
VRLGDALEDRVVLHGGDGDGQQGADPGALAALEAADVMTPEQVAAALEQRRTINALREALFEHGMIG